MAEKKTKKEMRTALTQKKERFDHKARTIAVIDGNSLMHRAYHAVMAPMTAPDGTPTNAVFGFMQMFLKFAEETPFDALVCAFDVSKPTHRIAELEQYKAQRPPMDEALNVQFPLIYDLLDAMNVPQVKVPGWEGDDILGTIAARDEARGWNTLILSGDKDVCQLASDRTKIVTTKKGVSNVVVSGPTEVRENYGVTPEQFPDFLGLMGDKVDNIPGVPGIGPKSAAKLLQQFETLEGIYENTDKLKGKQKERIVEHKDDAFLSRKVATIKRDLTFDLDLDDISFPDFDEAKVNEAFGKLHLNSQLRRVLALKGGSSTSAPDQVIELDYKNPLTGEMGEKLVDAAISEGNVVGVAYAEDEQASLLGSGYYLAINAAGGHAVLEGESARTALAKLIQGTSVAAMDGKGVLEQVYPADSSEPALINDDDLFSASIHDISLAAYILYSSVPKYTVETLAEKYLGGTLPEPGTYDPEDKKSPAKKNGILDKTIISSMLSVEAAAMRKLVTPLQKKLEEDGLSKVYREIDLPLVPVLAHMERTGAALDVDHLKQIGSYAKGEIEQLKQKIYDVAGEEFNIDSPKQVSHILFEVLQLPHGKKTQNGYSTAAKVLTSLEDKSEVPGLILQYREYAKMESTYIDALPKMRKGDGLLHTSFNQTITTTGRLSSSDPNLQNIPVRSDFGRHIRECFVPLDTNSVFMSGDYSQVELRVLAHLSGDEHLIQAFQSGADFHAATAARVFNVDPQDVTPELRRRAKAVNFGIVYGQQAYGLSQSLHISFNEAQEMIDRYFEVYPQVKTFLDEIVANAYKTGYAETMYGRRRYIPELKSTNRQQRMFGERTAMNHPMQGTAADIIKIAMARVQKRLINEFPKAKLMLQVHDELDLSVPKDQVDEVGSMLEEEMNGAADLKVPLIAEISQGANWAEAH